MYNECVECFTCEDNGEWQGMDIEEQMREEFMLDLHKDKPDEVQIDERAFELFYRSDIK